MSKRLYQQGTTGILSLVTGRGIPLKNAIRSGMSAAAYMRPEMQSGPFNRLVQRNLGYKTSLARGAANIASGFDMVGTPAMGLLRYPLGVGARMANRFAELTAPGENNYVNQMLRATLTDHTIDMMHQSAKNMWEGSWC